MNSKIKQYVQHLGQTLKFLYRFSYCRSIYLSAWRPGITEDLEDSRSWMALSHGQHPADNTLFPDLHRDQALDPPHRNKVSAI